MGPIIIVSKHHKLFDPGGTAKAHRKASGCITIDGQEAADTIQCEHCGLHFVWTVELLKRGVWCRNCGLTCGRPECLECVHWRKKFEQAEREGKGY